MRTIFGRARTVLLLCSLGLLVTMFCATSVGAKPIVQHGKLQKQWQVGPFITQVDGSDTKTLDRRGCFKIGLRGSYFSPSNYKHSNYADLGATDLAGDKLRVKPWYAKINSKGVFVGNFKVCGVKADLTFVTLYAMDEDTGAYSNPLPVAISPIR